MTIIQSLILGLVEGLTEFLPVSSTFHLIATSRLLGLVQTDTLKLFEVVVQSGAIISIIWLYGKKLISDRTLLKKVLYSCLPTFTLGFLLYGLVKDYFFEAIWLQLSVFVLIGIIFIIYEYYHYHRGEVVSRTLSQLTIKHSILVGLFQVASVVPGVSRSGSILLGMLILGYDRRTAAEYAFMLSLPTIFAATALDLYKNQTLISSLTLVDLTTFGLGIIAAFLSALWVMKWLLRYLSNHSLSIFGYYRLVAAVILYNLL